MAGVYLSTISSVPSVEPSLTITQRSGSTRLRDHRLDRLLDECRLVAGRRDEDVVAAAWQLAGRVSSAAAEGRQSALEAVAVGTTPSLARSHSSSTTRLNSILWLSRRPARCSSSRPADGSGLAGTGTSGMRRPAGSRDKLAVHRAVEPLVDDVDGEAALLAREDLLGQEALADPPVQPLALAVAGP